MMFVEMEVYVVEIVVIYDWYIFFGFREIRGVD